MLNGVGWRSAALWDSVALKCIEWCWTVSSKLVWTLKPTDAYFGGKQRAKKSLGNSVTNDFVFSIYWHITLKVLNTMPHNTKAVLISVVIKVKYTTPISAILVSICTEYRTITMLINAENGIVLHRLTEAPSAMLCDAKIGLTVSNTVPFSATFGVKKYYSSVYDYNCL